jgi:ABC-2 type transport system ATP-binding protein
VHTLIQDLSKNGDHTVFLCTHNLAEAQRLCDRVAVLENGKMVALGSPAALAQELWKGVHLEFETAYDALPGALRTLETLPDVYDVIQGEGQPVISLSLTYREQVPGMVARLVEAGVPLYRLTPKDPTLEDIYFALHENKPEVNR